MKKKKKNTFISSIGSKINKRTCTCAFMVYQTHVLLPHMPPLSTHAHALETEGAVEVYTNWEISGIKTTDPPNRGWPAPVNTLKESSWEISIDAVFTQSKSNIKLSAQQATQEEVTTSLTDAVRERVETVEGEQGSLGFRWVLLPIGDRGTWCMLSLLNPLDQATN